jgi:hypothetical protein
MWRTHLSDGREGQSSIRCGFALGCGGCGGCGGLRRIEGSPTRTTETYERVPYERIVERAKGDVESVFTWTFHGENGKTKVKFEADYELPEKFFGRTEWPFVMRRNEFEAETLLSNLKAKLEV